MRKFLFLDIDGTLVTRKNIIPESARQAIEETRKKGNLCFICSGRNLQSCQSFECPEMDGVLYCSGAGILLNGKTFRETPIPGEVLTDTVELMRRLGAGYTLFHRTDGFTDPVQLKAFDGFAEVSGVTKEEIRRFYAIVPEDRYAGEEILKIDVTGSAEAFRGLEESLDPSLTLVVADPGTKRDHMFGEIVQKGISKGTAAEQILEHFGASVKDAYGFGDSMNDYELLKSCGTGIAMGESPADLVKIADYVTGTPEQDGLRNAMHHYSLL